MAGRADAALESMKTTMATQVAIDVADADIASPEEVSMKPDEIPEDVWAIVQESGREATNRLHELLVSPKFTRLKTSDQTKLISLAQNRAYGLPKTSRADLNKRRGRITDATAFALNDQAARAALPEYKQTVIDVELEE